MPPAWLASWTISHPVRLACARSNEAALVQTCLRDTGEVPVGVSLPVCVPTRHWGEVRVGITAANLSA